MMPAPRGYVPPPPLGYPPAEGWSLPEAKNAGALAYRDPGELFDKLNSFVRYISAERINEIKPLAKRDAIVPKVVVPTIQRLVNFLNITRQTWENMRARDDSLGLICERYENWAFDYTVTHAVAGVADPGTVHRLLGLADYHKSRTELNVNDSSHMDPDAREVSDYHAAVHVHPEDGDPLGMASGIWPRPLYSQAQLDAGMPFHPPAPKSTDPQIIEHEPIGETENAPEISGIHDDVETPPDPGGVRGLPRFNAR